MIKETSRTNEDSYQAISFDIIENGMTVGHATVMNDSISAYCERIDIDEPYRNHGYGTSALEDLSRMFGSIIVAPDNADAQRLYDRIGYEISDSIYDQGFGVYEI
jgi:ribosomal protein S18 acetylase RimI-like enzyme